MARARRTIKSAVTDIFGASSRWFYELLERTCRNRVELFVSFTANEKNNERAFLRMKCLQWKKIVTFKSFRGNSSHSFSLPPPFS